MELKHIGDLFGISGELVSSDHIKTGNINQTHLVKYSSNGVVTPYIFQKVNTYVFKKPEEVMANIIAVTGHISEKLAKEGKNSERSVLHFVQAPDSKYFVYDEEGNFWRIYKYIDDSLTFDKCEDLALMEQAGVGFGSFQKNLADFDASKLYESIPNFHNTEMRMNRLFEVAEKDELGRVKDVQNELDYVKETFSLSCTLCNLLKDKKIPLRVTHNDTKCNNVLIDKETNKALAVIDLDTVMPGLCAYDFGDAIRFGANNTFEDDPDVSKIFLDLDKYAAYTKGFIGTVRNDLTQIEFETMHLGAYIMTTELIARFMLDYLEGDVYFKLNYPEHNLIRTKAQAALAQDMDKKLDEMKKIVMEYSK